MINSTDRYFIERKYHDPEKEFEKKHTRQLVQQAISMLDSDHRDVIIMRDINGLSYDEISNVLNISTGTVKSRISRAREKLKNFLLKSGNLSGYLPSNLANKNERRD